MYALLYAHDATLIVETEVHLQIVFEIHDMLSTIVTTTILSQKTKFLGNESIKIKIIVDNRVVEEEQRFN